MTPLQYLNFPTIQEWREYCAATTYWINGKGGTTLSKQPPSRKKPASK